MSENVSKIPPAVPDTADFAVQQPVGPEDPPVNGAQELAKGSHRLGGWNAPYDTGDRIEAYYQKPPGLCLRVGKIVVEAVTGVGKQIRNRVARKVGETSTVWALKTLVEVRQVNEAEEWYKVKGHADITDVRRLA